MADTNPFASPDMQDTNPFASPDMIEGGVPAVPQSGAVMAGLHSVPSSLESMAGNAEGYSSRVANAAGASGLGDWLHQKSQDTLADAQASQNPTNTLAPDAGLASRATYQTAQGIGQIGAVGAAGFAAGAAIGGAAGLVTGPGAIVTALAGGALGWTIANVAALPALMGLSAAGSTADQTEAYQKAQGATDEQAKTTALGAGALSGAAVGSGAAVIGALGPLGKAVAPLAEIVGKAATGDVVSTALNITASNIAKSSGKAAVVGGLVGTAQGAATQEVDKQFAGGQGPTAGDLGESFLSNAAITGILHGASESVHAPGINKNFGVLSDPTADINDRQKAAAAAVALISTRDPELAQDFGVYASVQIAKGLPVDMAADHVYQAYSQDAQDQAAKYAAGQTSGGTTSSQYTPGQADQTFGPAPTDNSRPTLTPGAAGADASMQGQNINRPLPSDPNSLRTAILRDVPPVDSLPPLDPNNVPAGIDALTQANSLDSQFLDNAVAAAQQTMASTHAGAVDEAARQVLPPTGDVAEQPATPEALAPEQDFYAAQAAGAQTDLRAQAFDANAAINAPPAVPDDAFAQRQQSLAAQADQLRQQGHLNGVYDQAMNAPDRISTPAPAVAAQQAVARAAGEGETTPTAMSTQMTNAMNQLAARKPANLTTAQLEMVATHHPDPAVQDAAEQVLATRTNRTQAEPSQVAATGEMTGMRGPGAEPEAEFSQQRANPSPVVPSEGANLGAGSAEVAAKAPVAPEIAPLKESLDRNAQARGLDSAQDITPVSRDMLPDETTPANNGVEGATTLSKSDYDNLTAQADIFGKKVQLFRSQNPRPGEALDGAILSNDSKTVYVNADAAGAHHSVVFGHELAHQMQVEAPDLYNGLSKAVMKQAQSGALPDFAKYYGDTRNLSDPAVRAQVTNEFVSDLVGNRFSEANTWRQVFAGADKSNRGMVYRIANFVQKFISKLMDNGKFKQFATDDMVKNLTDVRTQVRRALSDYANQTGSERMQHEAEQLRAAKANRDAGEEPLKNLVEPVKGGQTARTPDMITGSRKAPAPVAERAAEPEQGTRNRIEASNERTTEAGSADAERSTEGSPRGNGAEHALSDGERANAQADGSRVELTHFSSRPGLTELDPEQHGTGLKGADLKRRDQDPENYLNRTYYGLDTGKPGGYVKESGLGNHEYRASVDASKLYDADKDTAGLYPKGDIGPYANRFSAYEKAIQGAGYQGYTTDHPQYGRAAAVFDKLPAKQQGVANEGRTETAAITGSAVSAGSAAADSVSRSGVVRGSPRWLAEQGRAHQGNDLAGVPSKVTIPGVGPVEIHSFKPAQDSAKTYAKNAGIDYTPPKTYAKVDPERATRIAQEFDRMQHDPQNPEVRSAYDALARETSAQYQALLDTGLKVEFIKAGQEDPYAASPRLAHLDVLDNNHMWVFSTKEGFGSSAFDPVDNPLLADSGHTIGGEPAMVNDLFRVVHDYYGHIANGVGFRADGEENAWRSHMAMYGDEARRAATTETRGQNSWVNFGPYGEANRTAGGADTHFADQKIGLLPDWVVNEGRTDEAATTRLGEDATVNDGTSNPFSSNAEVRKSGERASYLGNLDASQEAAVRNVSGALDPKKTIKQSLQETGKDLGKKMRQGIADQFDPIKELDDKAYMLTRLSKAGSSGPLEAALMYGAPVIRDGVYDVDVKGKGFAKIMSQLDGEHNRFFLWEAAQRAEQLKAEGRENLFTDNDIGALKTLDRSDAQHPDRAAKFAQVQKEYHAFNEQVLKIARDSGIMTDEDYKLFKDQPYVPFYRVMGDDGMKGPSMKSGLVNQYAYKKLKGGSQKLNDDLLGNVLTNWGHLFDASSKNRAAQATMEAAEKMGVATEVPAAAAGKGTVRVKVGGKDVHYEIDDPHLLAAVSAMSAVSPGWMKPLSTFKRMLTFGTTVSPMFKLRTLIRDSIQSIATGQLSGNVLKNVKQGIEGTTHHSQTFASMLASGGIIRMGSAMDGNDAANVHRLIMNGVPPHTILNRTNTDALFEKARSVWTAYQELGEKAENINRSALYQQLRAKGVNHAEASFQARDLMDFSMQGNWPVVRFLAQSVPFMNARIQGMYKLGRSAVENPARVATVVGSTMLASVALAAMYKDDPDWKNREDWDRDSYWWFKIGNQAYRIPKPFEVGAAASAAERTYDLITNKEMTAGRYGGALANIIGQQLAMNPTPQIVRPLMDVYANKDGFTGRPIENEAMQGLQAPDRYNAQTSMTARFLGSLGMPDPAQLMQGRYSALSPVQMDSLLHGYFGSLGSMALTATDSILRPMTGQPVAPAWTLKDYTGGLATNLPTEQGSQYVTRMYDNLNQIQQAYNSYHAYLKTGQFDQARDEMAENRGLIASEPMAAAASRAMATMNLQEKRIINDVNMSSDEKREKLDALNNRKNALAQRISMRELDRQQAQ